ncbi:hypothetical protein PLACP1_02750 [Planifilum fimeticola]
MIPLRTRDLSMEETADLPLSAVFFMKKYAFRVDFVLVFLAPLRRWNYDGWSGGGYHSAFRFRRQEKKPSWQEVR